MTDLMYGDVFLRASSQMRGRPLCMGLYRRRSLLCTRPQWWRTHADVKGSRLWLVPFDVLGCARLERCFVVNSWLVSSDVLGACRTMIGFPWRAVCARLRCGRCGRLLVPSSGCMRATLGVAAGSGRSLRCRWRDSSELEWGRRSGQYRIGYTGYIVFWHNFYNNYLTIRISLQFTCI